MYVLNANLSLLTDTHTYNISIRTSWSAFFDGFPKQMIPYNANQVSKIQLIKISAHPHLVQSDI